jgi:DNA-binding NarL/FixJ family response regulator
MVRILIADNYGIIRIGLKQILLGEFPAARIEEAGDSEILIKKVMKRQWDVVICDLSMPGRSGLDALKQIKQTFPKLPVLIMSIYSEDQYALRVLKAGAAGYLSKETIHEDLVKAVKTVLLGKRFITPLNAEILVNAINSSSDLPSHEWLSDREFDVFKLLASGKSVSEIAKQLLLGATTVSTYRARIFEKLNFKSNLELVRYALEKKLI